jgi:hypothetical protein
MGNGERGAGDGETLLFFKKSSKRFSYAAVQHSWGWKRVIGNGKRGTGMRNEERGTRNEELFFSLRKEDKN